MKKLLITLVGLILLVLIGFAAIRGIQIGNVSVYSVRNIQQDSQNLDAKIQDANTEISQNYANSLSSINTSIKRLRTAKEQYESKIALLNENPELGITQIEKYKIEYLWVKLDKYCSDQKIKLDLNIEETSIDNAYNIEFTLQGSYVGITNFLYKIEEDDELNYKPKNFKIEPTTRTVESTSGKTTTSTNTNTLKATFVVENIIINFN